VFGVIFTDYKLFLITFYITVSNFL